VKCAICGLSVGSIDEAIEKGWTPYFHDGAQEHDPACPSCTQALLQEGADGEWEVKEAFQGKLKYLDESLHEIWQDHSQVVGTVLEYEPGKLN
jgi:hypothetical protein